MRPLLSEIGYELFHDKIHSISNFKVFRSKCYIRNVDVRIDGA